MAKTKRSSSRAKKTIIQPVIGRFDDALPLSLQTAVEPKTRIKLHRNGGALSPYIVRLTKPNAPVLADPIASLKAQLLAQADLLAESTEQDEAEETETLGVNFNDLVSQFSESDRQLDEGAFEEERTGHRPVPTANERIENAASIVHELVEMPLDTSDLFTADPVAASEPIPTQLFVAQIEESSPEPTETSTPELPLALLPPEADPALPEAPSESSVVLTFSRPTEALTESFVDENLPEEIPVAHKTWFHFRFPDRVAIRAFATFVFLSFVFVLPLHAMQGLTSSQTIQANVTASSVEAIDAISKGADALSAERFDVAGSNFDQATATFADAQSTISDLNGTVAAVANILPQTNRTLSSAQGLVKAGQELSVSAGIFAKAGDDLSRQSAADLTTKLAVLSAYVSEAKPHIDAARSALEQVDPSVIPADYQERVRALTETVPAFADSLDEFSSFADTLSTILGKDRKMRYLLAFQNNAEMRPTGGFIGSYAQMDVLHGAIVDLELPGGGTYDVQGQLSAFVQPPAPIALVNPRWEFHDANWFPDFPTSAQKLLWFYSKAGGPTVDGVIAVNASLMPDILALLGPIEMPEYDRVIDSENFLFETQKMVEEDYVEYQDLTTDRTAPAPKQFLGDLAPKLLDRAQSAEPPTLLSIMQRIGQGLSEKDIQIFFQDNALQSQMETLGWSGSIKQTSGDSLMIIDTNLGGGKTDSVISEDVGLHVQIASDGTISNTVTITKTHHGLATALFESANNVDYIRLYVPQGSTLVHAEGFTPPPTDAFDTTDLPLTPDPDLALVMSNLTKDTASNTDIWNEEGKTVFGNWIQVGPGKTSTISFTYTLPFRVSFSEDTGLLAQAKARLGFKNLSDYTLLIQKQSGVARRTTHVTISLPVQDQIAWSSSDTDSNGTIEVTNARDAFLSFLLERAP